ncbi:MAG: MBL fold metallo-hydrolase [Christensenellales bacterium]|jgi:competence protein ComEC
MAKRTKKISKKTISVIAVLIIVIFIGVGLATGLISLDDIRSWLEPEETPINTPKEFSGVELVIGDELSGPVLDIHFIDVGQGDAIYIEFPDGKCMIIDGGDRNNTVSTALLAYLDAQNPNVIDYLLLTHTDSDHVGSLDIVLENYEVKRIFMPDIIASYGMEDIEEPNNIDTLQYKQFVEAANTETYSEGDGEFDAEITLNVDIITIEEDLYTMTIYCPEEEFYANFNNKSAAYKNNASPIIVIEYGGRTVILTGDADEDAEQRFVEQSVNAIDADVLKVAHHGGAESSNEFFLEHTDPEYAVISCGEGNSYNHPRQAAIDRLQDIGVEYLFRTDLHSDILLSIDGNGNMVFSLTENATQTAAFTGFE